MTAPLRRHTEDLSWVLTPLLDLPGVQNAVIATGDGLVTGHSADLGRDGADRVAAMTASLHAAARAFTTAFTGAEKVALSQTVVESEHGYAVVTPAGENSSLAVFAVPGADLGTIAYQMQVQVAALARALASPAREASRT
ncbi:roadblock/LC7 domain-containing protein [Kitasatospora phosalacinea]|uniref:roadblock/LC7 domain-containing protein n=1 Tax=Kitasatospora phosalacinea TaxID=2065 RepID=UPI000527F570|nr:roadblock/LC7 domain-containing protein [Kitasatospora phosalacinea]